LLVCACEDSEFGTIVASETFERPRGGDGGCSSIGGNSASAGDESDEGVMILVGGSFDTARLCARVWALPKLMRLPARGGSRAWGLS
jgi:hypothetical protein